MLADSLFVGGSLRQEQRCLASSIVEVSNPFGILFVGLLTFDGFDVFIVCKAHINVIYEIIKNRNLIFSSGFHTNMMAIILDGPVVKPLDIRIDG